jgi:hypothetical protein
VKGLILPVSLVILSEKSNFLLVNFIVEFKNKMLDKFVAGY